MRCSPLMQPVRRHIISSCRRGLAVFFLCALVGVCSLLYAQTGGTGAISGVITDSTGAIVVGAQVKVTDVGTGYKRMTQTNDQGIYAVSLLPPGKYTFEVTSPGFKAVTSPDVQVIVAQTTTLDIDLQPGAANETVTVDSTTVDLETQSSSLGRVTDAVLVSNLPLVTRNFTQIIGLNPGVSQEANNAGSAGRGGGGQGASPGSGSFLSNGATSVDNNFKMNGVPVNDVAQSPGGGSPGAPIPNPDTIQEFKVQTALYDATTGRNAGANVDVITKGGTNQYHMTMFEYFRNEALNANDWFANRSGQPRSILRQNQYGLTAGGPLKKDKLLFFGSWQGTKQLNGVDPTNHRLVALPPLTDDRSRAGLGAVFGGQAGYLGAFPGDIVLPDGSNISQPALNLLQAKLPNGQYVVPTPQTIDNSRPFDVRGSSYLSVPGTFDENQWMVNSDYLRNDKDKIAFRYFGQLSRLVATFPTSTPGFPLTYPQRFDVFSIGDTYVLSPHMANQFLVGFHRTTSDMQYQNAFKFSDLGISAPPQEDAYPQLYVYSAGFSAGTGASVSFLQYEYNISEMLSWVKGKHNFNFGGDFGYGRDVLRSFAYPGQVIALTWADLLLGGRFQFTPTLAYSNIYQSVNLYGDTGRDWRYKNWDAFIQDNYQVTHGLTLNLGLRFEHLAALGDAGGRMGNIDVAALNPNPGAGSIAGYIVPSNFQGTIPAGVGKVGTTSGFNNEGQNVWNPRLGFAWKLPKTDRFVLRGGAGVYHTSLIGQMNLQLTTTPPYGIFNALSGPANGGATLANPFPAVLPLPQFPAYSSSTQYSMWAIAMDFRPPTTYHYTLGLQSKLPGGAILDVAYAGARNLHMVMSTSINQALRASPSNPINGQTENTVANIDLRKPYLGWNTGQMRLFKTAGSGWYNSLQVSLSQQWKSRLYYQAAYTWARLLTAQPGTSLGTNYSFLSGDQNDLRKGYGPDPWIRPQRFVLSAVYNLPEPSKSNRLLYNTLGGWSLSTVALVQAGHQMGIAYSNSKNAFGITSDRPSFAPGCTAADISTSGTVSSRVNGYINAACLTFPTVIGSDGATDFGNTPLGILRGPSQFNIDLSLNKTVKVNWPQEGANVQFRTDFFNATNHPNFTDPNLAFNTPAFGTITAMSTNPRVIQFSLKYAF